MSLDFILNPIEQIVSYIFIYIHQFLTIIGFSKGPGVAWILSIVFLTVFVRLCILPLFLHQIKSTRKLQAVQPQMKSIQKRYEGKKDQASRQAQSKEMMELYQKEGVNPAGSCLPLLVQIPFFFSLYRLLSQIKPVSEGKAPNVGALTKEIAAEIEETRFFGIHLSDSLSTVPQFSAGFFVIAITIVLMIAVMFFSQKVITTKNMPVAAKEGPQYNAQKMMIYLYPVMYIFSGALFPYGVLVYWLTTNVWTAGQSAFQLYFMPTPGSDAAAAKEEREKKQKQKELQLLKTNDEEKYNEIMKVDEKKEQRKQPKRKSRKKD